MDYWRIFDIIVEKLNKTYRVKDLDVFSISFKGSGMNYNKKREKSQEYKSLTKKFIKRFEERESSQKFFSDTFSILNKKTNKRYSISSGIEEYVYGYFNTILQRVMYNKEISKKENLVPYFITFTLPSEYHPFITHRNGKKLKRKILNNKFKFDTIEESIPRSYKKLIEIFRNFYKQLKDNRKYRKEMRQLKFNYFIEYHKSFIPHLHLLVYVPSVPGVDKYVNKIYLNTIRKNGLNEKGNKLIKIEKKGKLGGIDGAVLYISKYITKTIEEIKKGKKNLKLYWGWKLYNGIRIFRGSHTKIGLKGYRKIYYSLNLSEKENLLKRVSKNRSCLLSEIERISRRDISIIDDNGEVQEKSKYGVNSNLKKIQYVIKEVKQKIVEKKYKNVYKIFKFMEKYEEMEEENEKVKYIYKYNNVYNGRYFNDDIMGLISSQVGIRSRKIKVYLDNLKKYIKMYKNKNKKYIELDKIVMFFKHKENILKKILKGMLKIIQDKIKTLKEWRCLEEYFLLDKLRKVKNRLIFSISIFDSIKKVSSLFFKVKYRVISYIIYKNGKEIYNNLDYELIQNDIQ